MNRKMAFSLVVLALMIGVFVGATRIPKIEQGNSFSEVTTINLRLNERYEADIRSRLPGASTNFFVYSGWKGPVSISYQITVVVRYTTGYAIGLTSYPIYVYEGATFHFDGRTFKVKQVTQEMITLERISR